MGPSPYTVGCEAEQPSGSEKRSCQHLEWLEQLARLLPSVQWLALVQLDGLEAETRVTGVTPAAAQALVPQSAGRLARQAVARRQALDLQIDASGAHLLVIALPHPHATRTETSAATTHALLAGHADLPEAQRTTLVRLARWAAHWLDAAPIASPPACAEALGTETGREMASGSAPAFSTESLTTECLALFRKHRNSDDAALAVVNLLHSRLACVRVSLGRTRHRTAMPTSGNTLTVRAVSGQSTLDTRRTLARQLHAAMAEAVAGQATVSHPGTDAPVELAAHDERPAHTRLCHEQGGHAIVSIPLIDAHYGVAVLVLEWAEASRTPDSRLKALTASLATLPALLGLLDDANASLSSRLRRQIAPRTPRLQRPGWRTALVAMLALLILSSVIPMTYQVNARATIEAADRQVINAPWSGFVRSAHARAGETVESGQLLATLDNSQLLLEADKWQAEQLKNEQERASALALHDRTELRRLRADARRITAELSLIESQLERSELRAPFDGVLISGDLSQSLGAPVETGSLLFEIASADSYTLLLDVEDRDMGAIKSGQSVTVRMAALPDQDWQARLNALLPVAVTGQGSSVFRLPATLEGEATSLRPGMEGIGKIQTSRHSMLWVFLHPLMNSLRLIGWRIGLL